MNTCGFTSRKYHLGSSLVTIAATEDAEDEEEEVDEVEVQLDRGDDVIVVPEALADCEVKNARECQGGP